MRITKTIYPLGTVERYVSAFDVIIENGYEHVGKYNTYNYSTALPCGRKYDIFMKDGKYYAYAGWSHYNTEIYWVGLQRISEERLERMDCDEYYLSHEER